MTVTRTIQACLEEPAPGRSTCAHFGTVRVGPNSQQGPEMPRLFLEQGELSARPEATGRHSPRFPSPCRDTSLYGKPDKLTHRRTKERAYGVCCDLFLCLAASSVKISTMVFLIESRSDLDAMCPSSFSAISAAMPR